MTYAPVPASQQMGVQTLAYWLLDAERGPLALPSELAATWHDGGERPVMLGTYADARAAMAEPQAVIQPTTAGAAQGELFGKAA